MWSRVAYYNLADHMRGLESTKKIVSSEFQDLHFSPNITRSLDSAVWLDVSGILVRFPAGSLLQSVQTGCGANPAS